MKEKKIHPIAANKDELFKICGQIANAMIHCHRHNIFLMDLSPETIFINEDKEVKLLSIKSL